MKAERLLIETISLQEDVYGANHVKTLVTKGNYAYVIKQLGRTEQASPQNRRGASESEGKATRSSP